MKRRRGRPAVVLALLGLFLLAALLAVDPARDEVDVSQERANAALPALPGGVAVSQTFVARHGGLWSVQVTARRERPEEALPEDSQVVLTLERTDRPDTAPVVVTLPAAEIQDGQNLRFRFPPLFDSRDVPYRMTVVVTGCPAGDCPLTLAYTAVEAYADGALTVGDLAPGGLPAGDLRFVTRYGYAVSAMLADAGRGLWSLLSLLPALLAVLVLPGVALAAWLLPRRDAPPFLSDPGTLAGLILALSVGFWPLLVLWSTTIGLRLTPAVAWWVCAALLVAAVGGWYRRGPLPRPGVPPGERGAGWALAAVVLLVALTRLWEIRDLVAPVWVDAVHHTYIAQLIAAQGSLPHYQPPGFLVSQFYYHFGFHADAAALVWLGDLSAPRAVLILGQALNVGAVLALYGVTSVWGRRRWAGVVAVAIAGLLAYMPAYYVSWSRYTQMVGLLVLAPLCLLTAELMRSPGRRRGMLATAAALLAGLALVHYRVLAFYVAFWLCYAVWALFVPERSAQQSSEDARPAPTRRRILVGLASTAGILALAALVLILPWIWRFVEAVAPTVVGVPGALAAPDSYNTGFPADLLKVGWTQALLIWAGLGAAWAVIRRAWRLVWVLPWVGLWFLLANLAVLGLENTWFLNNSAVVISFWVPVGILGGWLAADLGAMLIALGRKLWAGRGRWVAVGVVAAAALVLTLVGTWRLVDIVNPTTVLVTAEDVAAMDWIARHTPADARFVINTHYWQSGVRRGTDGGWWLTMLADRATTLPCVICYPEDGGRTQDAVNELAAAVEDSAASDAPLGDAALRARLRAAGAEYVYVGAKGGPLMPESLDGRPYLETLYVNGPVRVYRLRPE